MLLLVDLVRGHVFGGGETRAGARVSVALGDFCVRVLALRRGWRASRGSGAEVSWVGLDWTGLTLVALLGCSGHGTLDGLAGLVDGVPGRENRSGNGILERGVRGRWGRWGRGLLDCVHCECLVVCLE